MTPAAQTTAEHSYKSTRDSVSVIHRKVDALGGRRAKASVQDSLAPKSNEIQSFVPVVAPKPKKAPAKKVAKKPAKPVAKKAPAKKQVKKAAPKKIAAKPKSAPKKVAAKPAAKKPAAKRGPRKDYKGDVHEVVDLEGIGPTYEKRLHDAKIVNTQQLLFASDARLERLTGAKPKVIQNWKHMCQLIKVSGIGPQFAEVMVRAGIEGIEELKTLDPKAATKQIKDYTNSLSSNVLGSGIGVKRLTDWQGQAKKMRKVAIDMKKLNVVGLESRAAIQAKGRK